jgi:Vacuolar protein sorting-associated protein 26
MTVSRSSLWGALVSTWSSTGLCNSQLLTELFYDRGHHHEFLSLSQELAAPGEMRQAQTYDFNFKNVEKQFESYQGINVKLRFDWSL